MPLPIAAIGSLIGPIAGLIDDLFTNDEERAEAKRKLVEMEQAGRLDELKTSLSAILAEANSADPWTSRARPSFLYIIYLMMILAMVGSIIGIWWPDHVATAASNLTNLLNAIPESVWWLFGAGYLGYSGARSFDKWKGAAK